MGDMMGGMMGGDAMGGFMGGSGDPGDEMNAGGNTGDPGGEMNAGGGTPAGEEDSGRGGGGGILNTLQGLVKSAGGKCGSSNSSSTAPASPAIASGIQIQALRNIVGLVSSAFSSKQSANRLQLKNQVVSEGNS
jgi:hypothetical protein